MSDRKKQDKKQEVPEEQDEIDYFEEEEEEIIDDDSDYLPSDEDKGDKKQNHAPVQQAPPSYAEAQDPAPAPAPVQLTPEQEVQQLTARLEDLGFAVTLFPRSGRCGSPTKKGQSDLDEYFYCGCVFVVQLYFRVFYYIFRIDI
jgi:hypothetical protein